MTGRAGRPLRGLPTAGATVGVIGLSSTGVSVARRLHERGIKVRLIEEIAGGTEAVISEASRLRAAGIDVVLEDGGPGSGIGHIDGCTLIVTSPGVPERAEILKRALANGIEVWSEFELAHRILESRRAAGERVEVVAISGTNGKTTVTTLLARAGEEGGRPAVACGNIGYPFVDAACERPDGTLLVAEVSSFQLRFCTTFRPDVALLLNFTPDHLDWHPTVGAYSDAKGRLFAEQTTGDTAIWNADDAGASEIAERWVAPAAIGTTFTKGEPPLGATGIVGGEVVDAAGVPVIGVGEIARRGAPALENSLAVVAGAHSLGIPRPAVRAVLAGFEGLPHRMERVGAFAGAEYVDDSKATNPHAAARAITAFDSVVLIAGGKNKGLDLSAMVPPEGGGDRIRGVVAFGDAAGEVATVFSSAGVGQVEMAPDMRTAVAAAAAIARPGDTVLLSPGCASFDLYESYAHRGDDFRSEMERLAAAETGLGGE